MNSTSKSKARQRLAGGLLAVAISMVMAYVALPVVSIDMPLSTVLTDRNGDLLGATIATDQQWRFPASDHVPEKFAQAIVTFEDKRFYDHPGVDPLAVARAMRLNIAAGAVKSGGSTLTMQTVRISRSNPPRTIPQKLFEMALAIRLDGALSKEEILSMYAANAPMGGNTVGLEAAAWRYFGRPADDLSWGEAATLAVLPNSPGLIHPGRNRDALQAKRDRLLDSMADKGIITNDDASLAKAESLPNTPHPIPQVAPHLLMNARASGHHKTESTLVRSMQRRVNDVVERHAEQLEGNGVHNAAALVLDVETGEVVAYFGNVGGLKRNDHHNHVDIVHAPRSTGSTLKPFLYGTMVERGELSPNQIVPDTPTHISGFSPENFDRHYDGALRAPEALARSRNVPAVWMLQKYGVDRFQGQLTRMGMNTLHRDPSEYGLSLILGGSEATLWELTAMYRNMAWSVEHPNSSERQAAHWRGEASIDEAEVLDPGAAWLTMQALLEVNRPGVHGSWKQFDSGQRVAWKTGTSFGFRDAWAIGVTPRYAIGVWVGNADGEGRANLTGFTAAAPILFDLFDVVDTKNAWFSQPYSHLDEVRVCAHSGQPAGPNCSHSSLQQVPSSAAPSQPCEYCELVHLNADATFQVNATCEPLEGIQHQSWFTLPPAMAWFHARTNPTYRAPPPIRQDCREAPAREFTLLYPAAGSEVYVPIELDGERGRVVFEATHRDRSARMFWHLDDTFVGTTQDVHQVAVAPPPGDHVLTVVDHTGARMVRPFTVLEG
jgi:penicillin-binding protein 1C